MHTSTISSFPFRSVLNLRLLVEYWERAIESGAVPAFANGLKDALLAAPELREPIQDLSVLEKHKGLVDFLMTAVIPPANSEHDLAAATIPFRFEAFYSTQAFLSTISFAQIDQKAQINIPVKDMIAGKTVHACLLILEKYYSASILLDKPILFTIRNEKTGLDRVYKVEIGNQFVEIVAKVAPPPIDPKIIRFLTEKVYDVDLWLQYIRPEDFEFHGFMIFRLVDVTEQEMLSAIKYDLLEKNAVTRQENFASIQQKLRSIFGMPDIRLGLAYFDSNNKIVLNSGEKEECWSAPFDDRDARELCEYNGSVYERSWMEGRYVTIEDLATYPFKSKVEEMLLEKGVRNILLAPLKDGDETIGILELSSVVPGKLNPISANKVENALPMFTAAVKRVKEEMVTEVRAIIQEECTNLHPSIQWRFFEAGNNLLQKRRRGEHAVLEDIVFKEVYPLFGLADVRNSSQERTNAIQKDLLDNLNLAKDLLKQIFESNPLPLLEEIIFKIASHRHKIDKGLASGDESNVLEFLKQEINPLVAHFENDTKHKHAIEAYRSHLDPVFGVVYRRRKSFEESLSLINKTIGALLDDAQRKAQAMFPHYYEKYQTDGVEFTLYLGSSLTRERTFDPFYLKNFRLWQLMVMCEIDLKIEELKPRLKNPLDITQLILVHDQPLSIRFRADEKQFDVDGAYDIRYEIIKKRIDKALVKDSSERLTQPGKIVVVYNQSKVEKEYHHYFEYLRSKSVISGPVEALDVEELPGATGLKALRVTINHPATSAKRESVLHGLEEALMIQ